jgi:enoyl-CoA hydratase/carnithine racemase
MAVSWRLEGEVFWVVLERPEKLNALDEEMWVKLREAVEKGCSSSASLVALRGSGRAFCTGDDISAMASLRDGSSSYKFFSVVEEGFISIINCSKPVAALIHGYAFGGCAELLLLMDLVVAVKGTRISFPEPRLGLVPPLLAGLGPILLGRKAFYLALMGVEIDAEEALRIGLVDVIVDTIAEGERAVRDYARRVSALESRAVMVTRRIAWRSIMRLASMEGFEALKSLVLTVEAMERMKAFLERRLR